MISREGIFEKRDELMARRDELMERADHLREEFMDNVDGDAVTMAVGLSLVSGGVAWGLTYALRGRRGFLAALAPLGLIAAGLVIAGRGAMGRRSVRIGVAEERVRDELSGLDPLARARVLRDMASEQLSFVRHSQN